MNLGNRGNKMSHRTGFILLICILLSLVLVSAAELYGSIKNDDDNMSMNSAVRFRGEVIVSYYTVIEGIDACVFKLQDGTAVNTHGAFYCRQGIKPGDFIQGHGVLRIDDVGWVITSQNIIRVFEFE